MVQMGKSEAIVETAALKGGRMRISITEGTWKQLTKHPERWVYGKEEGGNIPNVIAEVRPSEQEWEWIVYHDQRAVAEGESYRPSGLGATKEEAMREAERYMKEHLLSPSLA
jgi:hypothetical protein